MQNNIEFIRNFDKYNWLNYTYIIAWNSKNIYYFLKTDAYNLKISNKLCTKKFGTKNNMLQQPQEADTLSQVIPQG